MPPAKRPGTRDPRRGTRARAAAVAAAALAAALAACATVPITGRSQLMLVSPQDEARLGAAAFQQLAREESGKGQVVSPGQDPALYQAWGRWRSKPAPWGCASRT